MDVVGSCQGSQQAPKVVSDAPETMLEARAQSGTACPVFGGQAQNARRWSRRFPAVWLQQLASLRRRPGLFTRNPHSKPRG